MKHLYTYKFRLKPNAEQEVLLSKHFGCVRWVFNYYLNKRIDSYKKDKTSLKRKDNEKELPLLKKEHPFLREPGSQSLQFSIECLQNSYENFFHKVKLKKQGKHKGKCGFPRFKKKHGKQSFRVKQNIKLQNGRLIFPKFLDGISVIEDRELEGEIQFATISKNKAGQYHAAITVIREIEALEYSENTIGLDLNVKELVDSNGNRYENPRPARKYKDRLKFLHQKVSRSVKGTKGRTKAKQKLAKLYQHIHNVREDWLHKLSTKLVRENQTICIEDLCIAGMLKKTKPEDRVEKRWEEKKRHRDIQDCGWYSLVQKLLYKSKWYGRQCIRIDRWYPSSQTCHHCGWRNRELKPTDRVWMCLECWELNDRDYNAALNIRTVGMTGLADCPDVRPAESGLLVGSETPTL